MLTDLWFTIIVYIQDFKHSHEQKSRDDKSEDRS